MKDSVPPSDKGFDVIINGVNRFFADLEISAIASAGFCKESYPEDKVRIRNRAEKLRTVLGYARIE